MEVPPSASMARTAEVPGRLQGRAAQDQDKQAGGVGIPSAQGGWGSGQHSNKRGEINQSSLSHNMATEMFCSRQRTAQSQQNGP